MNFVAGFLFVELVFKMVFGLFQLAGHTLVLLRDLLWAIHGSVTGRR